MTRVGISFSKQHFLIKKWAVPRIIGSGPIAAMIKSSSKLANQMFRTPLPCTNPHFAFYYRGRFEKSPGLKCERIFLECDDGGIVGMDKVICSNETTPADQNKPIILIFPGCLTHTYSTKVQTVSTAYMKAGYGDIFICNERGRCHAPLKTMKLSFPNGNNNDVHTYVNYMRNNYRGRKILLFGSSWGALFVVDYLSMSGKFPVPEQVLGGVVHSVTWPDVRKIYREESMYRKYGRPQFLDIRNLLIGKDSKISHLVVDKLGKSKVDELLGLSISNGEQFDFFVDMLLNHSILDGSMVQDVDDYLQKLSPLPKMRSIERPLVIINAHDDPTCHIMTGNDIVEIENNQNLCLWLFKTGGHCGYVTQMFPGVENIIDEVVTECSSIVHMFKHSANVQT